MTTSDRLTFWVFYKTYLTEHQHPVSRLLHYIGSWLAICTVVVANLSSSPRLLLLVPIVGYSFAWVGHFIFERNKPATFRHPFFSLAADWVMWWQITSFQLALWNKNDS